MTLYNWKKIAPKRRGGRFDDGALITIKTNTSRVKYNTVVFHKLLKLKVNAGAKYVSFFYSPKGYLGFKFLSQEEKDCYLLRKNGNRKEEIRSAMLEYFMARKYFEGDVKVENGMAIIKVELQDPKKIPIFEGEEEQIKEILTKKHKRIKE